MHPWWAVHYPQKGQELSSHLEETINAINTAIGAVASATESVGTAATSAEQSTQHAVAFGAEIPIVKMNEILETVQRAVSVIMESRSTLETARNEALGLKQSGAWPG